MSYLLAGAAMRSPICTSVQPVFFRMAPTSPCALAAGLVCFGCLDRSFSSRVYCRASALTWFGNISVSLLLIGSLGGPFTVALSFTYT